MLIVIVFTYSNFRCILEIDPGALDATQEEINDTATLLQYNSS